MKEFLYTAETLELFRTMIRQKPKEVICDNVEAAFIFDTYHILAQLISLEADSQNKSDESITLVFSRRNSAYVSNGSVTSLVKNKSIEKIWIMRTLLYFTDFKAFETKGEAVAGLDKPASRLQESIYELLMTSTGGYDEIIAHPNSSEAEVVNKDFANLVDKGILLQVDGKFIGCFAPKNWFRIESEFFTEEALKEKVMPYYQLIEVV